MSVSRSREMRSMVPPENIVSFELWQMRNRYFTQKYPCYDDVSVKAGVIIDIPKANDIELGLSTTSGSIDGKENGPANAATAKADEYHDLEKP